MGLHLGELDIYSYDARDSDQRHLKYVLENMLQRGVYWLYSFRRLKRRRNFKYTVGSLS